MSDDLGLSAAPGSAVVIVAGGGIGAALMARLRALNDGSDMMGLSRNTVPALDYSDEASVQAAAQWVAQRCEASGQPVRLLIVATRFLHGDSGLPERSFMNLDAAYLQQVFAINTLRPALVNTSMFHNDALIRRRDGLQAGCQISRFVSDNYDG